MKTRIIGLILLLLVLVALIQHDTKKMEPILGFFNQIKEAYQQVTNDVSDTINKYFSQADNITKLSTQNEILQKQILDQSNYIRQLAIVHQAIPSLNQYPQGSVTLAQTISYVKLNSFSQIILTKPKGIIDNKLYGLVDNGIVSGVAKSDGVQFYGYLATDENCHFSVFIGEDKAPGIARGAGEDLIAVRFIPKWYDIKEGDSVATSGLDNIFFANIPVGKVTKVETQSNYKVAYVKPFANLLHPRIFFVLLDARPTLLFDFDISTLNIPKQSQQQEKHSLLKEVDAEDIDEVNEIFEIINQTQEEVLHPEPHIDQSSQRPIPTKPTQTPSTPSRPSAPLDMF